MSLGKEPELPTQRPSESAPVVRFTFSGMVSCATKALALDTAADQSPSPFTGSGNGSHYERWERKKGETHWMG